MKNLHPPRLAACEAISTSLQVASILDPVSYRIAVILLMDKSNRPNANDCDCHIPSLFKIALAIQYQELVFVCVCIC